MGRKAGVTPEETRHAILAAAGELFTEKGYDGASIAGIARAAGVSSGAIYAHHGSKAALFAAVLEARGERAFTAVVGGEPISDIIEVFRAIGSTLDQRAPIDADLVVAAVIAARRDPEVTKRVGDWLTRDEATNRVLVAESQAAGLVDADLAPEALVRFATMLSLGAQLVRAMDLPPIAHDDWIAVISRLVDAARPD